jgi:hypothetical protein
MRRETVEHPFGTIKARMGSTHFLMKRLRSVAAEMALHVLAYNLTRGHEHRWQAELDCSHPRYLNAGRYAQKRNNASRYLLLLEDPTQNVGRLQ